MENPTTVALSSLIVRQRSIEVTADNIANADTPGYRTERMLFSDWLSQQTDAATPKGGRIVSYVQDRATYREQTAGAITHTGNPFDLALGGDGFFSVRTPAGPRLTRAGRFTPQADGTLTDTSGNALLDNAGQPLRLSAADTDVVVAADGSISSENGPLGKIGIVEPGDLNQLTAEGSRLFSTNAPTTQVASPKLIQGAIEGSNVQSVSEITRMLDSERSFQMVIQFVEAESTRQQTAIDKLSQTQAS